MSAALPASRDFLALSRRFLDVLGADGLGDEADQQQLAVDGIEPGWVLQPAGAQQAQEVLAICAAHDLSVVPAGLGLRLAQGNRPARLDAVLSTSRMDRIVEHAAEDLTITVEAGATLAAVNSRLGGSRQCLPFDPALPAETTIGGLLAANAAGPSRQAFGTAREWLLGVRAALADGTLVKSGGRVVKNVAGYDVHKLLIGSFGTLAVILEATFKLQPLPEATRLLTFATPELGLVFRLGSTLADSPLSPRFVEILVEDDAPPRLVIGLAGLREEVEEGIRRTVETAEGLGIEPDAKGLADDGLHGWLQAFALGRDAAVVLRAGVRRDAAHRWLAEAFAESRAGAHSVCAHAHVGVGVARVRLDSPDLERLPELVTSLRAAAVRGGGSLVVEAAPAAWKPALDVWGPPGAGFPLMKGVKAAFDPRGILAPGRFVGGL